MSRFDRERTSTHPVGSVEVEPHALATDRTDTRAISGIATAMVAVMLAKAELDRALLALETEVLRAHLRR